MVENTTLIVALGAGCFGAVIGWCVYYSLVRWDNYGPSQLGVLITAVLGGVVLTFFTDKYSSGAYGIGLAIGFFSFAFFAQRYYQRKRRRRSTGKGQVTDEPASIFRFESMEQEEEGDSGIGEDVPASEYFGDSKPASE